MGDPTVTTEHTGDVTVIENDQLRVEIGLDGAIARLYDTANHRETLTDRANQLWAYVDKPRAWDAWDVDESHERDGEEIGGVACIAATESGPLRVSVRVERRWRGSTITQTYRLWTGSRRLDIETEIDWHERQVLLKARFPLAVHTHEATFETMFGVVRRPTHRNTAHDAARFEGSGHRFADLSEAGYGVALLNDGKYGHSFRDTTVGLSLLKGGIFPDPEADRGMHRFTYSLLPHAGDWREAAVTRRAYELNAPLQARPASGPSLEQASFLSCSAEHVVVETVKVADDGDGTIVRLYEAHNRRGTAELRFGRSIAGAVEVDLREREFGPATIEGDALRCEVRPFEIKTFRVRFT